MTPPILPRSLEIIALAQLGMDVAGIADHVGCKRVTVYETLHRARQRGEPIPSMRTIKGTIRIPGSVGGDAARILIAEAERRGIKPCTLATRLLRRVCLDDLFNAVLDDGDNP